MSSQTIDMVKQNGIPGATEIAQPPRLSHMPYQNPLLLILPEGVPPQTQNPHGISHILNSKTFLISGGRAEGTHAPRNGGENQ
jgi:hypothetical protein